MDSDARFKYAKRLFGNIKFVGELFRRSLISEGIIVSVFESLLGTSDSEIARKAVNDDTIEGATVLMDKIGYMLDEKLAKNKADPGKTESLIKKNKEFNDQIAIIFTRLELIGNDQGQSYPDISKRVKILTLNMLDDRKSGWGKSRKQNEKGPKKVEELKKELEAKQREEEKLRQQQDYDEYYDGGYDDRRGGDRRGGKGGYDDRRGGDRRGGGTVYQKKGGPKGGNYNDNSDTVSQGSYKDRNERGGKRDYNDRRQSERGPRGGRGQGRGGNHGA